MFKAIAFLLAAVTLSACVVAPYDPPRRGYYHDQPHRCWWDHGYRVCR